MKFSFNAVWDDTIALVQAHFPLVLAIAGVFIFLPSILLGHFVPQPQPNADPQIQQAEMIAYAKANWHWLLLTILATIEGSLAIMVLVLDRQRPTVGEAIVRALPILPTYLLCLVLVSFVLGIAVLILALLIGGIAAAIGPAALVVSVLPVLALVIYASARLTPLTAVLVAEEVRNPFTAIMRSVALTNGRGWAIAGLLVLMLLAITVLSLAIGSVVGLLLMAFLSTGLAQFISLLVSSAVSAVLTAFLILLMAAIYRQLSGTASPAAVLD